MIRRRVAVPLAAALALAGLAGCPGDPGEAEIELYRISAPPPAATVQFHVNPLAIELSLGVAIAARCWDSCDATCIAPAIAADDPAILDVRPVYRQDASDADVVLIAASAGTTRLRVATACATASYAVTILDAE